MSPTAHHHHSVTDYADEEQRDAGAVRVLVPPSSMMQMSGGAALPSTPTEATRSTQSWMASVMWGTTCTVLPRYSPRRSCVRTDEPGDGERAENAVLPRETDLLDDAVIDLASGDVVVLVEGEVHEAFVVAQVEIGFTTIVQHEHLW